VRREGWTQTEPRFCGVPAGQMSTRTAGGCRPSSRRGSGRSGSDPATRRGGANWTRGRPRPFLRRFPAAICSPVRWARGWCARAGSGPKALADSGRVRPPSPRRGSWRGLRLRGRCRGLGSGLPRAWALSSACSGLLRPRGSWPPARSGSIHRRSAGRLQSSVLGALGGRVGACSEGSVGQH
jgi:hypothetical protein